MTIVRSSATWSIRAAIARVSLPCGGASVASTSSRPSMIATIVADESGLVDVHAMPAEDPSGTCTMRAADARRWLPPK